MAQAQVQLISVAPDKNLWPPTKPWGAALALLGKKIELESIAIYVLYDGISSKEKQQGNHGKNHRKTQGN